jgi:hypothetical protein
LWPLLSIYEYASISVMSPVAEYCQASRISVHLFPGGHCRTSGTVIQMAIIGATGLKQTKSGFKIAQPNLCKVLSNPCNRIVGEISSKALQLGDVRLRNISRLPMPSLLQFDHRKPLVPSLLTIMLEWQMRSESPSVCARAWYLASQIWY